MNDHSPNLDVLRSLAVSFVVLSHVLLDNSLAHIGIYHSQTLGTLGVMIFFVHTCLVLMRSLERQQSASTRRSLALPFLTSRFFRIYPLSVFVVLVLATIGGPDPHQHLTPLIFISNIFLVQNLTGSASITPVLWSLPFEVQMYLFLPALYWWSRASARHAWRWMLALWCAFVLLVGVFWRFGVNFDLIKFFPCFLPGVLAYCLRTMRRRWSAGILFAYVGANAILYPLLVGLGTSATVLSWGICLGLGALIPMCVDVQSMWLRTVASTVARYSYGIYLVHVSVLDVVFHRLTGIPSAVAWLLFIGGVVALSYLTYHMIEKPGIGFGHMLIGRMTTFRSRSAQNIRRAESDVHRT
jgi:peptidoglycan/LPS O-acetylase OafA/YrhL